MRIRNCQKCNKELSRSAIHVGSKLCRACTNLAASRPSPPCSDCGGKLGRSTFLRGRTRCHKCSIKHRFSDIAKPPAPKFKGPLLNPDNCEVCAGLPWRRGEDGNGNVVASTCERCGLPREEEAPLQLLDFLVAQETAPMVESQTRFHGRAL